MVKKRTKVVAGRGLASMAVDSSGEGAAAKNTAAPIADAGGASDVAAGEAPQAMEAESTKAKAKLKLPQGSKSILGVKVGKRGQNTKAQKKRKLKKLERALKHNEKVTEKDAKSGLRERQRQTAKSLWGNKTENMFSVLAS